MVPWSKNSSQLLSPEESDKEEPLDKEGERPLPLPLRLSLSVEEEEDSLLRRLRAFFNFFNFFSLLRNLDDCVDDAARLLLPVIALTDPFSSWVVMPSASLKSEENRVETTTLVPAAAAAGAAAAAAALVPGFISPP
jgi:hypothetical protein